MKTAILIIALILIVILLIWFLIVTLKKNHELKKEIKALKEQREFHVKLEKETNEKLKKINTGNLEHDVAESSKLMHELSKNRRK